MSTNIRVDVGIVGIRKYCRMANVILITKLQNECLISVTISTLIPVVFWGLSHLYSWVNYYSSTSQYKSTH